MAFLLQIGMRIAFRYYICLKSNAWQKESMLTTMQKYCNAIFIEQLFCNAAF